MKRGYSKEFTPRTDTYGRYLLDLIPAQMWRDVKAKCKREGVSVRAVCLGAFRDFLLTPATMKELDAMVEDAAPHVESSTTP